MRIIYQLSAVGTCALTGGQFKVKSKKVFLTEQSAKDHTEEFIDLCCDESQLRCAERQGLKIEVLQLELQDK